MSDANDLVSVKIRFDGKVLTFEAENSTMFIPRNRWGDIKALVEPNIADKVDAAFAQIEESA